MGFFGVLAAHFGAMSERFFANPFTFFAVRDALFHCRCFGHGFHNDDWEINRANVQFTR